MTKSKKDWLLDSYEKADGFDQQLNDWKDRLDYERDIAMAKDAMTEATKTYQDSAYRSQQSAPSGKAHTETQVLKKGQAFGESPVLVPHPLKAMLPMGALSEVLHLIATPMDNKVKAKAFWKSATGTTKEPLSLMKEIL